MTEENGAPERIRTSDPQIRSLVLYPAELRAHVRRVGGRRGSGDIGGAAARRNPWRLRPVRLPLTPTGMRAATLSILPLAVLALSSCSTPGGPYPSLQPRAGEAVDPRVPAARPMNDRPVTPALASRLAELIAEAHQGDAAFEPAADQAQKLANAAGPAHSESWIAAQEALTAAIAARGPTSNALADIDTLGATALQSQGGLAPNDLAAVKRAGAEAGAIDQRQAARVKAIQGRLGI